MKIPIWLVIPGGMLFVLGGVYGAWLQHALNTGNQPAPATIESSAVSRVREEEEQFSPEIVFDYKVGGLTYTSDRVFPLAACGSRAWAGDVVARFRAGDQTTAWYDPMHPDEAFLLKHYEFYPYAMILGGAFMLMIAPSAIRQGKRTRKLDLAPRQLGNGWFHLQALGTLKSAVRSLLPLGAVWQVVGLSTCGHYFAIGGELSALAVVATAAWNAVGLVVLGIGFYALWLSRWLTDAIVTVDRTIATAGEPIIVRVQQTVRRAARFRGLDIELVCEKGSVFWVKMVPVELPKRAWSVKQTAFANYEAHAGETIAVEFELPIPPNATPTGAPNWLNAGRVVWKLKQVTRLRGLPPCPDTFEITVKEEILDANDLDNLIEDQRFAEASPHIP